MENKFHLEVTAHIAELSKSRTGGTLELNKTRFDDKPERWDLRRWYLADDGTKCAGRGVTLSDYEFEQLKAVMMDY